METDDEQVEKLKKWWQENGKAVIAGVIIGVGGLFGYRGWVDYQNDQAEAASAEFTAMVEAINADNLDTAQQKAGDIISNYADSEYAVLASLTLAKVYVEQSSFDQAETELQKVVGKISNEPLGLLARKRLAAVQLQLQQYDKALSTLSFDFPEQFEASVEELKGDIYNFKGEAKSAVDAYKRALQGRPGPANAELVQQKIDDLGLTG